MPLSQEHVGSKIVAKIKIYILTRAELLLNLCYEIPCSTQIHSTLLSSSDMIAKVIKYYLLTDTKIEKAFSEVVWFVINIYVSWRYRLDNHLCIKSVNV